MLIARKLQDLEITDSHFSTSCTMSHLDSVTDFYTCNIESLKLVGDITPPVYQNFRRDSSEGVAGLSRGSTYASSDRSVRRLELGGHF